jgi:hypothetical protein
MKINPSKGKCETTPWISWLLIIVEKGAMVEVPFVKMLFQTRILYVVLFCSVSSGHISNGATLIVYLSVITMWS